MPPKTKSKKAKALQKNSNSELLALRPEELAEALERSSRLVRDKKKIEDEIKHYEEKSLFGDVRTLQKSSVIFGQKEGGSAVCISPKGVILTCAHCLGEGDQLMLGMQVALVLDSGEVLLAKAVKIAESMDLALLECIGRYDRVRSTPNKPVWSGLDVASQPFSFTPVCGEGSTQAMAMKTVELEANADAPRGGISSSSSSSGSANRSGTETKKSARRGKHHCRLLCIGAQSDGPRSLDIGISTGEYLGIRDPTGDLDDNFELGQLTHSCWTYFGTSGAPLFYDGALVGLHSSWCGGTGQRHGVHHNTIRKFVGLDLVLAPQQDAGRIEEGTACFAPAATGRKRQKKNVSAADCIGSSSIGSSAQAAAVVDLSRSP